MNPLLRIPALGLALGMLLAGTALHAQLTIHVAQSTPSPNVFDIQFPIISRAIPDASQSGVSDSRIVSGLPNVIQKIAVTLSITGSDSGAFNGDFYAYLSHGGAASILLNRPGRRADNPVGYADNGFSALRFEDGAANGDIHTYRFTLFGDHYTELQPSQSPLTGTWEPDGRSVNPSTVVTTDPRSAMLNVFNGFDGNGAWTLFVADMESGGTAVMNTWSMEVTVVPEPASVGILTGGAALLFGAWLRRQRKVAGSS